MKLKSEVQNCCICNIKIEKGCLHWIDWLCLIALNWQGPRLGVFRKWKDHGIVTKLRRTGENFWILTLLYCLKQVFFKAIKKVEFRLISKFSFCFEKMWSGQDPTGPPAAAASDWWCSIFSVAIARTGSKCIFTC